MPAPPARGIPPMLAFSRKLAHGISLEVLQEADAPELFAALDANRAYLSRWVPRLNENQNPADTLAFIQSTRKLAADNLGFSVAIRIENQIAGVAGYHTFDWPNRSCILGYWLVESRQGRGIATQTCQALIDFVFAALNVNRVAIACAVENTRSRAIPERLGFRSEGIVRDAEWLYTRYVDHALYSLLQREWQAQILANPQRLLPPNLQIA